MKNRKPYDLALFTRMYNLYQMLACSFFVFIGYKYGFRITNAWKCTDDPKFDGFVTEKDMEMYNYCWYFILLRLSEFLETVFFILRKKENQVSALHLYHHISTVAILWIFLLNTGGFMEAFIAVVNSAVHVVMYAYYFFSSFRKLKRITNVVKPVITCVQVVQLVLILGHCVVAVMPGCRNSKLFYLQIANIGFLILMFVKFFHESFVKKSAIQKMD